MKIRLLVLCFWLCTGLVYAQEKAALAKKHFDEGNEHLWSGHWTNALNSYNLAIGSDSSRAEYFLRRAEVYKNMQKPDKALADCNSAIERNPYYADAYEMRSQLRYQLKDYDGSVRDHDTYKEMKKQKGASSLLAWSYASKKDDLRAGLSWIRQMQQDYNHRYDLLSIKKWCQERIEVIDTLDKDLQIVVFETMAMACMQTKEVTRAINYFDKAINLIDATDTASAYTHRYLAELGYSIYYRRADLYLKDKNSKKAVDCFLNITYIDPANAQAYFSIAQIYATDGNKEGTIEYLGKALENGLQWSALAQTPQIDALVKDEAGYKDLKGKYPTEGPK